MRTLSCQYLRADIVPWLMGAEWPIDPHWHYPRAKAISQFSFHKGDRVPNILVHLIVSCLCVERIWTGLLIFLSLTFVLTCEPCLDSSSSVVDLLSAGPDMNYVLWLDLIFALSLFRIIFSFLFNLWRAFKNSFELSKENTSWNHCYHGVASIIILALNFILSTTIALPHDIKGPLVIVIRSIPYCGVSWPFQCVGIVKKL